MQGISQIQRHICYKLFLFLGSLRFLVFGSLLLISFYRSHQDPSQCLAGYHQGKDNEVATELVPVRYVGGQHRVYVRDVRGFNHYSS